MLKLIKSIFSWLMRLLYPVQPGRRLYGYVYIINNTFTNSMYIGTSISQDKINEIKMTYYGSEKYKLTIVQQVHSSSHKDRQKLLSELKERYYTIYSKNHIVMQI